MKDLITIISALFIAVYAYPAPVFGADSEDRAREFFQTGQKKYELERYDAALNAFVNAFVAWEHPAFLFNIAQCYRNLEQHPEAIFFYRAYLEKMPDAGNRDLVLDYIMSSLEAIDEIGISPTPQLPDRISGIFKKHEIDSPVDDQEHAETDISEEDRIPAPEDAVAVIRAEPPEPKPLIEQWWVWTTAGALLAGSVVAIGLAVRNDSLPDSSLSPTIKIE